MKRFYPKAIICLFFIIPLYCGCIGSPTEDPLLPGGDLLGINLEPTNVTLVVGHVTKFLATGIFPGGATYDLTSFVSWVSSNPSVAYFLADGTLVANAPGTATISSVYNGVNSQSISVTVPGAPSPGQTEVPVLRSITVSPKFATIEEEGSIQYTCAGIFSD
ncbi:Ig-like domain-containing protein, partial [bacterium]|nr:Ig-like domain-containing protein [bacterium]MBU1025472.1 Ig-like domain-containing protein [bacterium]